MAEQLEHLCGWAGLSGERREEVRSAFRALTAGALDRPAAARYDGLSRINPDGLPFQWSFSLGPGARSVRFLSEVGPPGTSCRDRAEASRRALEELLVAIGHPGADWLWTEVAPAAFPEGGPRDGWESAIWYAVAATERGLYLKAYLNMEAGSPRDRWLRIGRVLLALGRAAALERLCEISGDVSSDSWPVGLAVDIHPDGRPGRLKAYFRAGEVAGSWIARWYAAAGMEREVEVLDGVLSAFPWHADRPYWEGSLFMSPEFSPGGALTLKADLAVSRWVATDAHVAAGIERAARLLGLDPAPYVDARRAVGDAPVCDTATRTHHVVGVGTEEDGSRHLNIYCEPNIPLSLSRRHARAMKPTILFAAWLLVGASLLSAQQVRRDAATGDYYVTVYDDDLRPTEVRVVPADKVEASVRPSVSASGEAIRYAYRVRVAPGSPQGLDMFVVECPAGESAVARIEATGLDPSDRLLTRRAFWGGRWSCSALLGALPLDPGQELDLHFESPLLPAVGTALLVGAVEGVSWPTSDPIPENDAARAFVESVTGIRGGWKTLATVVPAREPASLTDPAAGVSLLRSDLGRACGDLGWITAPGVCRSLDVKLEEAAQALEQGRAAVARHQLSGFLQELEAQHGEEPGKHVDDRAYALLAALAGRVLTLP